MNNLKIFFQNYSYYLLFTYIIEVVEEALESTPGTKYVLLRQLSGY